MSRQSTISFLLFPARSLSFRVGVPTRPSLCSSQLVSASHPIALFPCPDSSLPLQSPVGEAPHSVAHSVIFLPCLDSSLPLLSPAGTGSCCNAVRSTCIRSTSPFDTESSPMCSYMYVLETHYPQLRSNQLDLM